MNSAQNQSNFLFKQSNDYFQQEKIGIIKLLTGNTAQMQFQNNWDTAFDQFAQGVSSGKQGLCQSQINCQAKGQFRPISLVRQQNRHYRGQELVRMLENYQPISDFLNWEELKSDPNSQLKKYRQSVYFGAIIDGSRNGIGIMLYTNGRIFEGNWKDNFKHGKGYEKFQNGAIYNGTYSNGKPQGYGTYSWDNGETYEGQWIDGQKHGSGIWRGPQGDSYIGQWKQNQAFGYGVHTWINGDRYQGEFQNCLKHGEGVQKFANGDSYKGLYCNGKPQGYGEYYWSMGSFFKGTFKNGLRDGKGIWKRGPGNSDKYEGEYKEDKKDGYGVFIWENGNVYKGNFVDDLREGYGEMYFNNGSCFKGQWKEGQQVSGEMEEYHNPSGTEHEADQWCTHVQRRNFSQGAPRARNRINYQHQQRANVPEQVLDLGNDSFFQQQPAYYFNQPSHPSLIDAQKRFRARGINSKKSSRQVLESQKTRSVISSKSTDNRMFKRNIPMNKNEGTPKKMRQGQSESKMMSSTFFLYKIHGQNPDASSNLNARPRMVKTSGGMRQKHISQQIKYFTRNKINPEFI